MTTTTQGASVALVMLVFTNSLISQSSPKADSTAIQLQFSRFQEVLLAHDTISIGDFYTDDAVSLLQNQPVRRGRNSIAQRWNKSLANPILIRLTSSEINLSVTGQDAFQFGRFEIRAADTSNALLATGKVMILWRKQADHWRMALEMDNFDAMPSRKPPDQTK
ncbi:MAG: nuclear transport factor 2 family protein [Ignavibacteriales bacterium]|nr:nuclear transport factor 2 family protein [Ignavibacteriales bacterium]